VKTKGLVGAFTSIMPVMAPEEHLLRILIEVLFQGSHESPMCLLTVILRKMPAATDAVQISNAALAAFQEATKTPAQTAKEAGEAIFRLRNYSQERLPQRRQQKQVILNSSVSSFS
jgi:hypothetical protein